MVCDNLLFFCHFFSVQNCTFDKSFEQGVRFIGTALEFRVILYTYIERIVCNFNRFYEHIVRRGAADFKSRLFQFVFIAVVEFIAVSVSL